MRVSDMRLYVVKGGVNLRFFFRSPRYSEDMDIDVLGGAVTTLKKNGYKILEQDGLLRALRTYGIEELILSDPDKAKHTETTQRFRLRLVTSSGEELPTKVEFSRRSDVPAQGEAPVELVSPEIVHNYQRLSFRVQHYNGQQAVAQKLDALAGRAVTQARDAFDLHLLLRAGVINRQQLARATSAATRERALKSLNTLSFADFRGQVLEFLDAETRQTVDPEQEWSNIQAELTALIEAN